MVDASLATLASAVLALGRPPERVLEVECGDAAATLFLAREFPSARVRGCDSSAEMVREATERVGLDPEGRVAFKHAGGRSLPFPDRFFDLVVQRRGPIRPAELARVTAPDGHLVLVPPRGALLERRLRRRGFVPGEGSGDTPLPFLLARLDD